MWFSFAKPQNVQCFVKGLRKCRQLGFTALLDGSKLVQLDRKIWLLLRKIQWRISWILFPLLKTTVTGHLMVKTKAVKPSKGVVQRLRVKRQVQTPRGVPKQGSFVHSRSFLTFQCKNMNNKSISERSFSFVNPQNAQCFVKDSLQKMPSTSLYCFPGQQ